MTESTYDILYSDVVGRMKDVGGLKNEARLAKVLGITPQALSNYKKRQTISGDLLFKFSNVYGVSIDWLISGNGDMVRHNSSKDSTPLSTIAFVKAAPFVHGEGKQGIKVTGISTMTPDELISIGKLVKIFRNQDITLSEALRYSIDGMLESIEVAKKSIET